MMALDPLALAKETEKIVADDERRKYYRFRPAHFYGGIATADCVGCNLRCAFCWAWNVVTKPDKAGEFYSPEEVVQRIVDIAKRKKFRQVRISGNEPTIARKHLLAVLEQIPKDITFILETNGILIGADISYARDIAQFEGVHVRVALKGSDPEEFSRLTGAVPEAYKYQLKALEYLKAAGANFHPAIMSFWNREYITEKLREIDENLPSMLERETLIPYPPVIERLRRIGIEVPI